jgi:hypothetical protein
MTPPNDDRPFRVRMLSETNVSEGFVEFFANLIKDGRFVRYDEGADKVISVPPLLFGWPMPAPTKTIIRLYDNEQSIKEFRDRIEFFLKKNARHP